MSPWARLAVFALVFIGVAILIISAITASTSDFSVPDWSKPVAELVGALVAYGVVTMYTEARIPPFELAPRRALGLVKGLVLGLVLAGVCVGILAATGTYTITGVNSSYSPWSDLFVIGVVAGVAEEIMFRGVVFRLLEEGVGTWGAVIVSAVLFGVLHLSNPDGTWWGAASIAVEAGILFAAVYAVTRSLWWCVGLHFAWNVAEGPIFGSAVSGSGHVNSWLVSSWSGPEILTGGSFGLEASIVPVVLLGALGIALLVLAQRKGAMVAPMWTRRRVLTHGQADPRRDPAM